MATTDPKFNPTQNLHIAAIKQRSAEISEIIKEGCPDNHIRQLALDHLRIATMLSVQSFFESGD